MSYGWDRTEEFFHLVQLHTPQNHQPLPVVGADSYAGIRGNRSRIEAPAEYRLSAQETQFSRDAVSIDHELSQSERKIEELQKLAKHRGIFEDRSTEIQALIYDIKQTVVALNSRIDTLDRAAQASTGETVHNQVHHRSVVQTLRARLGEVTRRLKTILEERAKAMKNQEDRRSLYSHSAAPAPRFHDDESLQSHDLEAGEQTRLQRFAPRESSYQSARAEAVETVQKMIGELAQIFNRVATLVTAQEELTVRIEDDMSSALHNLQQGEAHLLKYFRSISSNRSLIFKVFAILILFIVFFVLFLA